MLHNWNKMKKNCFLLTLFTLIFFVSCTSKQDYIDFKRLSNLDSLISTNPQLVVDSLKKVHISSLSKYNYGYYLLLDVISKDKTYYEFHSDSLIKLSVKRLSAKKKQHPYNYARGLMYEGFVRFRMGIMDSTVYVPIRNATDIFEKERYGNLENLYLCYHYLGKIQDSNQNTENSIRYFLKALQISKITKRQDHQFVTTLELFWDYLEQNKYENAKIILDTLKKYSKRNPENELDIQVANASFQNHSELNYKKAIEYNMDI